MAAAKDKAKKDKKEKEKNKGEPDPKHARDLLNQVEKAQKPVKAATGRKDGKPKTTVKGNSAEQVEAAQRAPSSRSTNSTFKRIRKRPEAKEGQVEADQLAKGTKKKKGTKKGGEGEKASSDSDVDEAGAEEGEPSDDDDGDVNGAGDSSGDDEELTESDAPPKPSPAKKVKKVVSTSTKGKSKSEDVDLTVDAHQLKRYCIDAVKMFIEENIVTLDETWSPVVAQRKDVDKEIRRLADYCGVVPGVVDKKMRTHFDGL